MLILQTFYNINNETNYISKWFCSLLSYGDTTCPMYVDVANRIYERIKRVGLNLPNADKLKKEIAINVAIYYEDKMSGIYLIGWINI